MEELRRIEYIIKILVHFSIGLAIFYFILSFILVMLGQPFDWFSGIIIFLCPVVGFITHQHTKSQNDKLEEETERIRKEWNKVITDILKSENIKKDETND